MAESLMNRYKINLSNEYGSIGEKVAKKWLKENGYKVYSYEVIGWKLSELRLVERRMRRRRKQEYVEKDKAILQRAEADLRELFGENLEDIKKFDEAIRKLAKDEAQTRLARKYRRVGIGPDFVVKKEGNVFLVEVKVNESQPKKYQKESLKIAQEYGFRTYVLRLSVGIRIEESSIQLTET